MRFDFVGKSGFSRIFAVFRSTLLALPLLFTWAMPAQAFDAAISTFNTSVRADWPTLAGFEAMGLADPNGATTDYCRVRYENLRLGPTMGLNRSGNSILELRGFLGNAAFNRNVAPREIFNNIVSPVVATTPALTNAMAADFATACSITDFTIVSQTSPNGSNYANSSYHGITFRGRQGGVLYQWEVAFSGLTNTQLINTRTAVAAAPLLSFNAIVQGVQQTVGRDFSYNIVTMASAGPTSGTLTLTATLPAGQTYAARTGTAWTCNAAGQVVTCTTETAIAVNTNGPPLSIFVTPTAANSGFVQRFTLSGGGAAASANTDSASITVNDVPQTSVQVASTTLTQGVAATPFTPVTRTSGGTAGFAWSVSPALPTGLNLNPITGEITGTPTAASASTAYTFTVTDLRGATATGQASVAVLAPQEIDVSASIGGAVTDGGTNAQGSRTVGTPVTVTYTVANSGTANLTLATATASSPSGVTVGNITAPGATTIAPGGTTTFQVTYTPTAAGAFSFNLSFVNNDGDENPFNFAISGTATAPTPVLSLLVQGPIGGTQTVGRSFFHTIVVGATGAATSGRLTLTLPLPAGHTFVRFTATRWTCSSAGQAVTCITDIPILENTTNLLSIDLVSSVAGSNLVHSFSVSGGGAAAAANADSLTFNVNEVPQTGVQVPSTTLTRGVAATPFTPVTRTSGGTAGFAWSVSPALPTGLNLNPITGEVTGTPTIVSASTDYTFTLRDVRGATSAKTANITVNPAVPTITNVSPNKGPAGGTNSVVITGTNFTGASAVNFGATAATVFTVNSPEQITATVPPGTGRVNVSVTTPDGTSVDNGTADDYRYLLPPTATVAFQRSSIIADGVDAATYRITITNPNSVPLEGVGFTQVYPAGLTWKSGTFVNGAVACGFAGTASPSLNLGGATLSANRICDIEVQVVSSTPGSYNLTLTSLTSEAGNGVLPSTPTPLNVGSAAPTITGISPSSGPTAGGTLVTIAGTNFTNASTVSFGATAASSVSFVSATELRATSPVNATAGAVNVSVTTAGVTSANTAADDFTYVAVPVLGLTATPSATQQTQGRPFTFTVTPSASGAAAGPAQLRLEATFPQFWNVNGASNADWTCSSGTAGGAITVSCTSVTPIAAGSNGTPVTITVNPATANTAGYSQSFTLSGGGAAANATVTAPSVVVNGLTQTSVQVLNTTLTQGVVATPFTPVTRTSGGTPGFTWSVNPNLPTGLTLNPATNEITGTPTVVSPNTQYFFTITDARGSTSVGTANIAVNAAAPTISSISRANGTTFGGTNLTITGSNFTNASRVSFGTTDVTTFTSITDTQITLVTPARTAGLVDVSVTTPTATSADIGTGDNFTFVAPRLTINDITLAEGNSGTTSFTFTLGMNVAAPDVGSVSVDYATASGTATAGEDFTAASGTATFAAGASTTTVTVPVIGDTTFEGDEVFFVNLTNPQRVTFADNQGNGSIINDDAVPVPVVTGIDVVSGPAAGGTSVVITGQNFTGVTAVNFGNVPARSFTVNTNSRITATTEAGTGVAAVRVTTTLGGTSDIAANGNFAFLAPPTVSVTFLETSIPANGVDTATYRISLTNPNSVPLGGVNISQNIPTGLTYRDMSFTCFAVLNETATTLSLSSITMPGSANCIYNVVFSGSVAGSYDMTVRAVTSRGGNATVPAATTLTVTPLAQTITFAAPGAQSFGTSPSLTATASSGLAVAFSSQTPAVCTITAGGALTFVSAGTCDIAANQPGNTNFAAAPQVTRSFAVNTAAQTITFAAPGAQSFGTSPSLTATASSGLAVAFSSQTPAVCTITAGGALTFVSAGTCDIAANQPGNTNFAAAPQVTRSFAVNTAAQTITFAAPGAQTFGTSPSLTATASSGLAVAFSSQTPAVCTITAGGALTFVSAGTCDIAANQPGNTNFAAAPQVTRSFAVNTAAQTITFAAPGAQTFGTSPSLTATASSGLAVAFSSQSPAVCTITAGGALTFVSAGTCDIAANQPGNTNFAAAAQVTRSFAVNTAAQTITFAAPGAQTFGTSPSLTATASSGLAVAFSSQSPAVCTITAGGALTFVSAGTCDIAANQPGNTNFAAAPQVTRSFAVNTAAQTITFAAPGAQTFGTSPSLTATASSGLAVAFSSQTPAVCTITAGGALTFVSAGTCDIAANQPGNTNFAAAPQVTRSFAVNTAAQTITFAAPGAQTFGTSPSLTATASSGLAVAFSSQTPAVCTITAGGALTFVSAGTCDIAANQPGNTNFAAAPQVTRSFAVNTAAQTITFAAPGAQTFGTSPSLTATASSGLAVAFSSQSPAVCTITAGGALTFVSAGTCDIAANQPGNTNFAAAPQVTRSFAVNTAAQTITFAAPGAQTFGTSPSLTATASSGLAVAFSSQTPAVCTITAGGALTFVSAGTCDIAANQPGNTNFAAAAQVTRSFAVNTAAQTITFAAPGAQTFGTSPSLTATASSGLAVAFSSQSPAVCTITAGGALTFVSAGTCDIAANQPGNTNFAAAPQVTRSFAVNTAAQTITFAAPGAQTFGTSPSLTATASSGLAVAFSSQSPAVCTITAGGALTFVSAGTCDIAANQPGNTNFAAAAQVTRSFAVNTAAQTITFAAPGAQTFGTSPSLTATASSGLAVAFSSQSPAVCTITAGGALTFVSAGTCDIAANQPGNTNFAAAPQVTRSFAVNTAAQTITFAAPGAQIFGTSPSLTATASSGLAVAFSSQSPAVCTITAGGALTFVSAGTCDIAANQPGNTNFAAAPQVTRSFAVNTAAQTITFAAPGAQSFGTSPSLTATASSGLAVAFSSQSPAVCTITAGGALTFVSAGTCDIAANQPGNTNFAAAPQVTRSFAVNTAAQTITFAEPTGTLLVPGDQVTLSATASSGLPVVFTGLTPEICTASTEGLLRLVKPGPCSVAADQPGTTTVAPAERVTRTILVGGVDPVAEGNLVANMQLARARSLVLNQPSLTSLLDESPVDSTGVNVSTKGANIDLVRMGGPVWVRVTGTMSRQDGGGSSHYLQFNLGTHLRLGPNTILGLMGTFDSMRMNDPLGYSEGKGWLVGPYLVTKLGDSALTLEMRALSGRTQDNVAQSGQVASEVWGQRSLLIAKLSGSYKVNEKLSLSPTFSLASVDETSDPYLAAGGTQIGRISSTYRQQSIGLDWRYQTDNAAGAQIFYGGLGLFTSQEQQNRMGEGLNYTLGITQDIGTGSNIKFEVFGSRDFRNKVDRLGMSLLLQSKF